MSTSATHRHFHDELSELKSKLLTMSAEAQAALGLALDALLKRDAELAARVIGGDRAIDAMELQIEEAIVDLFATQQPMARDLRLLLATMKIATDLERVGDHAVNILLVLSNSTSSPRYMKAVKSDTRAACCMLCVTMTMV